MEQTINEELLRKVQTAIKDAPQHFDMTTYFSTTKCGTTACIAGWAIMLGEAHLTLSAARSFQSSVNAIELNACRLLNINIATAAKLFHAICWPDEFKARYFGATTPAEKAQAACDRIDHFIENYGTNN